MILYKYLPPLRIDTLQERRIRFTQPADFNDPFEFRPPINSAAKAEEVRAHLEQNFESLVATELAKYGRLVESIPRDLLAQLLTAQKPHLPELYQLLEASMLPNVSSALDGFFNSKVGVLCLSEVRDLLLMWGHYTDSHRGFVIGFDSNNSFFSQRRSEHDEFGYLRQVDYRLQRPKVVLTDTSSEVWFQTKSEVWSYEKEWRMLRVLSDADDRIDVAPFPISLFEFPSDAVVEIIIGMQTPASVVATLSDLAVQFPRATLLKAREHPSNYALVVEPMGK